MAEAKVGATAEAKLGLPAHIWVGGPSFAGVDPRRWFAGIWRVGPFSEGVLLAPGDFIGGVNMCWTAYRRARASKRVLVRRKRRF